MSYATIEIQELFKNCLLLAFASFKIVPTLTLFLCNLSSIRFLCDGIGGLLGKLTHRKLRDFFSSTQLSFLLLTLVDTPSKNFVF